MYLTRHGTGGGWRWAVDGRWLPEGMTLGMMLQMRIANNSGVLASLADADAPTGALATGSSAIGSPASGLLMPPVDPTTEVWASGVTYLRSREAREAESQTADIYTRVYTAERPELFFKSVGERVVGDRGSVRIRRDSSWNVPEPELALVINAFGEIAGYTAGNDMSSRSIEAENPLYLPQAKIYDGSCALGPGIRLASVGEIRQLGVTLDIRRQGQAVFMDETSTRQMKRSFEELVSYLYRELSFPRGAILLTGTGIVPPDGFSLQVGDEVHVQIGELRLVNVISE